MSKEKQSMFFNEKKTQANEEEKEIKGITTPPESLPEPEKKRFPQHKCPYCNNAMHFVRLRKHVNERTNYRYARMTHHCPNCDYWLRDDTPWVQAEKIMGKNIISLEEPVQA